MGSERTFNTQMTQRTCHNNKEIFLTLCAASFFISSCNLFKIWRFGLFFLAYCCSSITLLSELSCERQDVIEVRRLPCIMKKNLHHWHLILWDRQFHPQGNVFWTDTEEKTEECPHLLDHLIALSAVHAQQGAPVLHMRMKHLQDLLRCQLFAYPLVLAWCEVWIQVNRHDNSDIYSVCFGVTTQEVEDYGPLTPAAHGVFPTRHHIFTLLVFPRDDLKLNAGVSHSMVSTGEVKQSLIWSAHEGPAAALI